MEKFSLMALMDVICGTRDKHRLRKGCIIFHFPIFNSFFIGTFGKFDYTILEILFHVELIHISKVNV